jgi:hypothetical protein
MMLVYSYFPFGKNPSLFQVNQDSNGPFEIIEDGHLLGGGYMAGGYEPPNRYPKRMMKSKSCSTDLMKNLLQIFSWKKGQI